MLSRTITIHCCRQYNAVYRGGRLKAVKTIRPGDIISVKLSQVKIHRDENREIDRLAKVSLKHAKIN